MIPSVNKLVRGDVEVHLDGGLDGFWLQPGGYNPAIVEQNRDGTWPREVNEVLNLRIKGADANAIARSQKKLKLMGRQGGEFIRQQTDQTPTWWHQRLPGETEESRVLVRHIRTENRSPVYSSPLPNDGLVRDYTLGIARAPFREPLETTTITKSGLLDTDGDIWNYGAVDTVAGDAKARIASLRLYSQTGDGALSDWWCGIRSDLLGDRTAFEPVWQCEDGTPQIADTTDTGTEMTCTFATDTAMVERFTLTLTQAVGAPNVAEQRGQHLVLMRTQVTGTLVARMRLLSGYTRPAGGVWLEHDFVRISDTNFLYYPMGTIQVPPKTLHETQDIAEWEDESTFTVAIEAEWVSGAGNLVMERFVIIPQAEGWFSVRGAYANINALANASFVLTTPGDNFLVRPFNHQVVELTPRIEVDRVLGFYLPPGEASIVYAAQMSTQQVLGDQGYLEAIIYPRWTEFRGDDT